MARGGPGLLSSGRASGSGASGLRRGGRAGGCRADVPKIAADTGGCQSGRGNGPFPKEVQAPQPVRSSALAPSAVRKRCGVGARRLADQPGVPGAVPPSHLVSYSRRGGRGGGAAAEPPPYLPPQDPDPAAHCGERYQDDGSGRNPQPYRTARSRSPLPLVRPFRRVSVLAESASPPSPVPSDTTSPT